MGTKWSPERREKWEAKRAHRSAGRAPTKHRSQAHASGSPLNKEIAECLEARDLVSRIGWDIVRKLAARVQEVGS